MKKIFSKILAFILVLTLSFSLFGCSSPKFIELKSWFWTSGARNNLIIVNHYDRSIVCKYTAKNSSLNFIDNGFHYGTTVETKPYVYVSWNEFSRETGIVYEDIVTVLLIKDMKVIGYGLIKIWHNGEVAHDAEIIKQGLLKRSITEAEAIELIDRIKKVDR